MAETTRIGGQSSNRGWRFWMIFLCLVMTQFLTALELSAVQSAISTALPTIVNALHGNQFLWVGSAYSIATTAFIPLGGGLAQIFGRKLVMFSSIMIFALGSALCGAANSLNFLIAGRAVQGLGGGGISALCLIILSDLVPLQERGVFNAFIATSYAVANGVGPVIGGALAEYGQWRWLFYLNIPICGVAALLVLLFINLRTPPGTLMQKVNKIDWFGNVLVIASTTSCMLGLTWGGVQYPWTSFRVLVPLVLGIVGLVAFFVYEALVPKEPIVMYTLMATRTALSGFLQTCMLFVVMICIIYYMPVYFQACRSASPIASGVDMFGIAFSVAPMAILAGFTIAKSRRYRPQMWVSWCLILVGVGLFSTIQADSSRGRVIGFEIIAGTGLGMVSAAVFFPILAPLPVELHPHGIALYTFFRNFASVLGITLGGTVLQNELQKLLPAEFSVQFPEGTAIAYAIIPLIPTLQEPTRSEVITAFAGSLQVTWQMLIGISGLGLLLSIAMEGLPLHTDVDRRWGMEDRKEEPQPVFEMRNLKA